jgi:hypothetical protein
MARHAYCVVERLSPNIIKDNSGFVVALGQRFARSGWQPYRMSEIDTTSGDDSIVDVYRPPEEVLHPSTLASFEGKPICGIGHPARFAGPENANFVAKGHIQNVRRGDNDEEGNVTLIGDLHIHDSGVIEEVMSRRARDLSAAYTYDLDDGPREGTLCQRNILGNHVAIVQAGRAQNCAIGDSREDGEQVDAKKLDRLCELLEKLLKMNGGEEDPEAEDALPGVATGEAIAEGRLGEAAKNIGEGVASAASGASLATDLIPITNKGGEGNVNPVSATDGRAALQSLRNLRGFIEANGDRKAKDAYNDAIRAVKEQIALAEGFNPRTSAFDSSSRRQSEAASFESSAKKFHGKKINVHGGMPADERRASDSERVEESFEDAVARVRDEQVAKYTPRKRR